jgi:flagellar biosynthesis/type III secretory pathway protein FliH
MRSFPASKFIADLARPKEEKPAENEAQQRAQPLQLNAVQDKNTAEQRIAQARAQGYAEGQAAAMSQYQALLQEERDYYEKQLAVERLTWVSREADKLTEQLSEGLSALETRIADILADLLRPLLIDAARRRALGDLLQAIDTVLLKDQAVQLEISGPEDLQEVLREKLSGRNLSIRFIPGEGPEVRVIAGHTVLETQLAAWVSKVEEILR